MVIARTSLAWDILKRDSRYKTCGGCRKVLEDWLELQTYDVETPDPPIDTFCIIEMEYDEDPIDELEIEMEIIFENCKKCELNMFARCETDKGIFEKQIII